MKDDKLKRALYEALSPEYEKILADHDKEHQFSQKFNKDMEKLIKRRKKPYYKLINTVGKRVACVVCIFIVGSSITVLSVDALRNTVADFFVNIYEKFSTVQPENKENAPETIEDNYEITYDLSGYTIDYEYSTEYSRNIVYINDNIIIDFNQYTKSKFDRDVNTESATVSTISINNSEAIYFNDNHGYDNIILDNGYYIIVLSSNIGKDELINIAKSVQKVE